jgi:hypothetical protein
LPVTSSTEPRNGPPPLSTSRSPVPEVASTPVIQRLDCAASCRQAAYEELLLWNSTSRSGSRTGRLRTRTASTRLKMAAFAPMQSASVTTVTAVNARSRRSTRSA